jgi:hypothetical protein
MKEISKQVLITCSGWRRLLLLLLQPLEGGLVEEL